MDRLYADMGGKQTDNTRKNVATNAAVNKMIERQIATCENSQRILDYYKNGQKGNARG